MDQNAKAVVAAFMTLPAKDQDAAYVEIDLYWREKQLRDMAAERHDSAKRKS